MVCLPLSLVLTLSSFTAFGGGFDIGKLEGERVNERLCRVEETLDNQDAGLKLSTHEVGKYLDSSWNELYSDGNWFDAKATIQNMSCNPGSIDIKVLATDGFTTSVLYSTTDVSAGHSWTTGGIDKCYRSYTVYVRASDNSGTYTIRYWDNPA
jgi:hypothetical protein